MNRGQYVRDPEAGLPKIYLGLLAGGRLKPDRGHGRPVVPVPQRVNGAMDL
jgi:hypothetical protein